MSDKVIPVKVALRIRPLVPRELADACAECLRTLDDTPQVILGKDKAFTYDNVFSKTTPQIEVYESAVQPLLNALFNGYNTTVLAYGQTGSGKTHTMGSACSQNYDSDDIGVIPRVLDDLFRRIDESKDVKFTVKVSFVEVYNEEIKDLLNPKQVEPLNIREENNSIKVVNLTETSVSSALDTRELLDRGTSGRVVGGTAMNDQSSRSHAIFTITLEQLIEGNNHLIKSKFHLVDLAGSERQSKTKAEGLRLREGININLGLLALGNVISVLGEDNPTNKTKHVPYRESKLTRLLQDSLGGNSHTLMIACVSPADSNMEETLNTLRYADRARKIKNKPVVNIDPQAAEMANLRQQVHELKAQLFKVTGGIMPNTCFENASDVNLLKEENEKLKTENLKLAGELQRLIHINNITYQKMTKSEQDKEDLQKKFDEVKNLFQSVVKSCENQEPTNNNLDSTILKDLQVKLDEFEQSKIETQEQNQELNNEMMNEEENVVDKDYALRQAKMQIQLNEYDNELFKKQMLHQKMLESTSLYGGGIKYENCIQDLKHQVDSLEREKEDLLDLIKQGSESKKISDQRREKVRTLEAEVLELKKKEKEVLKLVKLKEENEKHCEKLRQEIVHIKQERVKLMKQMKADTDSFKKYKQEKEKEVNQLKAIERKNLVEITKLKEGNNRQEAVLRRKNEEISRIQRQLRDTVEKQKQVAEKRQLAFDRKDSSSMAEKLRQWITQEIEISVGLAECRLSLSKLIEERKELAGELKRLEEKYAEIQSNSVDDEPPNKLKREVLDATYFARPNDPGNNEMSEEVRELKNKIDGIKCDIECKNTQINEIQQMVIEGDQDDKSKHMFNSLHGMLEAKVLLKHLYSSSVQYLLDVKQKQINYENTTNGLNSDLKEYKRKSELLEDEIENLKRTSVVEMNSTTQFYENRILSLLKMNLNDPSYSNDDRFRVLAEQIDLLERKNDKELYRKKILDDTTNNSDDARRNRKHLREMRKTRVIRSDQNVENNQSTYQMISDDFVASPQVEVDNVDKDPDWLNTPLRIKQKKVSIKKLNRFSSSTKSKSSLKATDEGQTEENYGFND